LVQVFSSVVGFAQLELLALACEALPAAVLEEIVAGSPFAGTSDTLADELY
jgi:hypothetical protein